MGQRLLGQVRESKSWIPIAMMLNTFEAKRRENLCYITKEKSSMISIISESDYLSIKQADKIKR